jgi:carbon-monoxide dehydrogenase medium subunit
MIGAQYAKPRTVAAASSLLSSLGPGASIIAGGQELMPAINYNVFAPTVLVDINGLKELKGIKLDGDELSIGALCVHRAIEHDILVREHAPLLAHAVSCIGGGWQVRNRGTIGGNIVSVHPLYDIIPPLLTLNASVIMVRNGEERRLSLGQLLKSTDHALGTEAILTRITIPLMHAEASWSYYKLKNTHGAYASGNAAAIVALDGDQRQVANLRVTVGSIEPVPRDISESLRVFHGHELDGDALRKIERIARDAVCDPISDQRGDAAYRTAMAGVCARRAVEQAFDKAARPTRTTMGGI